MSTTTATTSPLAHEARALIRLAVPAIFTQLAMMLMGLVDTLMVSRLGTDALAASSLGNSWVFGTLVLGMGILFGIDPIVSQAHGAGDGPRAGRALQQGLVLAVLLSLPIAVLWLVTREALVLVGQDAGLAAAARGYVLVQIPSIPAFLVYTVLRQYLSDRGIMAPSLWVVCISNVVNVVLNWGLIFGHLGMPALGLVGAGLATMLARLFMALALAIYVVAARLHHGAWAPWSRAAVSLKGLREILSYGLPTGLQVGLEVWGFHGVALMAGILGPEPLAAHTIVLNLAALSFMVPLGISVAATTRVGNYTGSGHSEERRRAAMVALAMGGGVMAGSATLFTLLRHQLPLLWDPEPTVLALASAILPIAAAFQVFDGTQVVGCGVLRGIGDTRPAAWFNLLGYYGLGLPCGALLGFGLGLGLRGLWCGLVVGLMTVAILLVLRIRARM